MFTSHPEKSEPEVFGLVLSMDTAYYEGMKAESAFDKFLRGLGKVAIIIAIIIVVVAVGVKREEAKARDDSKQAVSSSPYGAEPEHSRSGTVYALDKWLKANVRGATPYDWFGPEQVKWDKDGEDILGWQVSVAYTARNSDGSIYTSRWLFLMRGDRIIDGKLAETYGYKNDS